MKRNAANLFAILAVLSGCTPPIGSSGSNAPDLPQALKGEAPQASHVVANSEEKPFLAAFIDHGAKVLYLIDPSSVSEAIRAGRWKLEWEQGATTAFVTKNEQSVALEVKTATADDVADKKPKVGDTRYLKQGHKERWSGGLGDCQTGTNASGPSGNQSYLIAGRYFWFLVDEGDVMKPEVYEEAFRDYFYGDSKCSNYVGQGPVKMNYWMTEPLQWPSPNEWFSSPWRPW